MSALPRADKLVTGFVVIGRNEGPRLEQCLNSVLRLSDRVVYADSASSDQSVRMAQALGVITVSLPDDGKLSAARGRNAGYAELRRQFPQCTAVQFLDGDCILQPEWIARAEEFLERHPDVAIVCGRRFEAYPEQSIYNGMCDREWNTPVGEAKECGGDALVRRAAFDQVQGYRSSLRAGEEPEMSARMRALGWRIWRIDEPMSEHDAKIVSFGQWWRRTRRGGFGYAQVWAASAGLPQRLYARNLSSAVGWGLILPIAIVIAAVFAGRPALLLLLPVAYGLQIARISRHVRGSATSRWMDAALIQTAKLAESIGALQYFFGGHRPRAFDYRHSD